LKTSFLISLRKREKQWRRTLYSLEMGSFGAALRRTREEKGISLDEIAAETRLSKRYLLALEDEAIHKLPGGTYNRAYLRSYADHLGLDGDRLVREYSLEEAHQTETGRLKPQLDVLASIGKAVESRGTSTGARPAWNVNWNWVAGRERERTIALFGGLGLLTVVLLTGLIGIGLRGLRQETTVPAAADRPTVASQPATPPAAAVTLPQDETPEPPRTPEPPAATTRSESNRAAVSPRSAPAPVPAPLAVPKPVPPASEKAEATATSPAAATASARTRSATRATKGRLSVTDSGVGVNVVDKRLVGESDTFTIGTRVTFWTRVAGGRRGDTISHVWFHNGVRIGATSLRVGSSDWRTQSNQLLTPDGRWAVEARDADGRILAHHDFRTAQR
jgi:cytoskeletal protein RodZ